LTLVSQEDLREKIPAQAGKQVLPHFAQDATMDHVAGPLSPSRLDMNDSHFKTRSALSGALIYAVVGCLWILFSDKAVESAVSDPDAIIRISMLKGWFYVGATSTLLFFLVRHYLGRLHRSYRREVEVLVERQHTFDLLAAIADNSGDAIFAKDLNGCYLLFNSAASRYVGKPEAEVIGKDDRCLFPPEQAERLTAIGERIIATESVETNEEVLDTALGERTFLATKGPLRDADGRIIGVFGVSRDITERIRAENALRISERRFHEIVDASADWIWELDTAGRYTFVSASVEALLGYTPAELIGKTPFDLMPPDEAERVGAEFSAIAARKAPFRDLDNINLRKDGRPIHVMTNGRPILAEDGTFLGYRGLDRDITERRAAELAQRQLADDLEATLRAIPDLLFELDAEGRYLVVKATHESLLAAPINRLLGSRVTDILPPEAAETVMAALAAARQAGTDYGRTITLPLAQGLSHFEISVARKTVTAGQGERFVVLSRDITARRTAQEQLLQRNAELERFNRATVGREIDMLEMKKTINALSRELGREPPYPLAFIDREAEMGKP
jgi:PAS domain S-box-containing protein